MQSLALRNKSHFRHAVFLFHALSSTLVLHYQRHHIKECSILGAYLLPPSLSPCALALKENIKFSMIM